MFDASEIFFLDRAVASGLLTAGQKRRIVEYRSQITEPIHVTSLVVDAGLMVHEEVQQVLAAIARGVTSSDEEDTRVRQGQSASRAPVMHPSTRPDVGMAVTRDTLAAIFAEGEAAARDEEVAKEIAIAIRSAMGERPDMAREAVYARGDDATSSRSTAGQPAFPLPPGAPGAGAYEASEPGYHGSPIPNALGMDEVPMESPLRPYVASVGELAEMLSD